jgi:hypothetical protein
MRKLGVSGNYRTKAGPSEHGLVADALATLKATLPSGWSVETLAGRPPLDRRSASTRPDAIVTIRAPDGAEGRIIIEAKAYMEPRGVANAVERVRQHQRALNVPSALIVTGFASPRTRQLLAESGVSYADSTGNVRLALERPAVFISTEGASSAPWGTDTSRTLRSLKGPTASRVVRALLDFRPPFGVQQLAERSGTSLGSVSRVFAFLEAEALIVRGRYGPVVDVRWADLLRRWTIDYSFAKSNTVQTFLDPRGLPSVIDRLRAFPARYAVTGSWATIGTVEIAAPRLVAIYVDDAREAADLLRLRPADGSANVVLAEPFDPVVYDRPREIEGIRYAALSQVAADLLTGPGRGPSEGEELTRWMEEHEDAWRG